MRRPTPAFLIVALVVGLVLSGIGKAQTPAGSEQLAPELIEAPATTVHARMDYGPRAGMEVSIAGMEARDTAQAVIRFKHTRDNAIAYCRDYVRDVTEECVQQTLAEETRFKDALTANCETGLFTDFFGVHYQFLGRNPKSGYFGDDKYLIKHLDTGEMVNSTITSWYLTTLRVYRALCPAHAPLEMDATVVSMEGRDTPKAVIKVRHTRQDAIHSCRERGTLPLERVTEDCIRQELAKRIDSVITADCTSGDFTDYYGIRYKASLNTHQVYPISVINIVNLATGQIVDPYSSDYKIREPLPIYRALCPAHAPF